MFDSAVMQFMYRFRLLDNLADERLRAFPNNLVLSYLAYRVAHEPTNGNSLLRCMRRVVDVIEEIGSYGDRHPAALEASIENILPYVSRQRFTGTGIVRWKGEVSEAKYEKCLFAASIRVNNLAIVRQCLKKNTELMSELRYLRNENLIYGRYDILLALRGGPEMMEYLMTHGTPTVNRDLRSTLFVEAARAGRADMVRYVYDFKRDGSRMGHTVLHEAQNTASLEALRFIAELQRVYPDTDFRNEGWEYWFCTCIEKGRLDTVEYALQLGAHPKGLGGMGNPRDNGPMRRACMRGYTAIVEHLLAHGASSEQTIAMASEWGRIELVQRLLEAGISPTNALSKASAGGYIEVVRLLLDAGVDPNETVGPKSPLASAIAKEHTAMFSLLIERGADLNADGVYEECVQRAKKDGLESMLLLLQAHGIEQII
jgi:hypothetical protein